MLAQLSALGPRRLFALAAVGLLVLGVIGVLAWRGTTSPMAPLYADLEARDAAAVVAALDRARVPYKLGAGGTQVMVAPEEVPRVRLLLAREGLPAGGAVGWEIFDRGESLTTTPFQQDVNRLRALEGELARTIRGLSGVRAARVHLVLPRREAFSRERAEAQASVVLAMAGGQRLDREGVQAVLHLVATAVPGLKPQNVSVVDSRGALLARGGQALSSSAAAAATQEEQRRAQELRIGRAVEELLERTLGPGRVRAEATVEMDFDRVETREERFDSDNQVPRSTQSTTESNRSAEGPPPTSVAGNLPGADQAGAGSGSQESRQEETTNFEIGRTTRATLREHPVVRRISVAVLVDSLAEPQADGPPRMREHTPEELARIAALVRAAAGLDERRGDKVEVVSMRFASLDDGRGTDGGGFLGLELPPSLLARLAESAMLALVALLAILLVGRPMLGRITTALNPAEALAAAGPAGSLPAPDRPGGAIGNEHGFSGQYLPEGGPHPQGGFQGGPQGNFQGGQQGNFQGQQGGGNQGSGGGGDASNGNVVGNGMAPAKAKGPRATAGEDEPMDEEGAEAMVQLAHVQGQMRASSVTALTRIVQANQDATLVVLRRWLIPEE